MSNLVSFNGFSPSVVDPTAQLPVGAYVARIEAVTMEDSPSGQRMVIKLDICEGEYTGYYHAAYEARSGGLYEARYRGVYSIHYPTGDGSERDGWAVRRFNLTIGAIQASNPGYAWDWNLDSLAGKVVGIVVREAEFNGNNFTEIGKMIPVTAVRSGCFIPMKKRVSTNGVPAALPSAALRHPAVPEGFTQVTDEDVHF